MYIIHAEDYYRTFIQCWSIEFTYQTSGRVDRKLHMTWTGKSVFPRLFRPHTSPKGTYSQVISISAARWRDFHLNLNFHDNKTYCLWTLLSSIEECDFFCTNSPRNFRNDELNIYTEISNQSHNEQVKQIEKAKQIFELANSHTC